MGGVEWSANGTESAQGVGTCFSVSIASRKATVPSPNSTTISKHSQLSATHSSGVSLIFSQLSRSRDTSEFFFVIQIWFHSIPTSHSPGL